MTFVSDTSQSQIKEVVRYLKRVSWDFCGIELLYSDLIDMAIEANKNGQELFDVVTDAKTFANSVKNELNRYRRSGCGCLCPASFHRYDFSPLLWFSG